MSPRLKFTKGHLFHMTTLERLPLIIASGLLRCDADLRGTDLPGLPVAHSRLKERRMRTPVDAPPGGVVGDYVPFYLAPRSPMLAANYYGNVPGRPPGQDGIIYLVTSLASVRSRPGVVLTNRHPVMRATFTDDLSRFDDESFIDWEVMFDPYFGPTEDDTDRGERRQAEVPVHQTVPLDAVLGIAARTNADLASARSVCVHIWPDWHLSTRSDWYF